MRACMTSSYEPEARFLSFHSRHIKCLDSGISHLIGNLTRPIFRIKYNWARIIIIEHGEADLEVVVLVTNFAIGLFLARTRTCAHQH